MRLFVAVRLPEEVKTNISRKLVALVPEEAFKHVEKENLHITICFIGEVLPEDAENLKAGFEKAELQDVAQFTVCCTGIGSFGKNVLWLGITEGAEELGKIAGIVSRGLGIVNPDFHAHITLARNRNASFEEAKEITEKLSKTNFSAEFPANSVCLMASELSRSGPHYEVVSERTFASISSGL